MIGMKLSDWDEDRENTKRERDWLVGTLASVERAMAIRQAHVDIIVDGQSVIWINSHHDLLDDECFDPTLILTHPRDYLRSALEKNDKTFEELGVEIDERLEKASVNASSDGSNHLR